MYKILPLLITAIFLLSGCGQKDSLSKNSLSIATGDAVIYGEDNRRNFSELQDPHLMDMAGKTVALISTYNISEKTSHYEVKTDTLGARYDLCTDEAFFDEIAIANCSGFLVAEDIIATAGHCLTSEQECLGTKFVFGFNDSITSTNNTIAKENVYSCSKLLHTVARDVDFALVKLDRKVTVAAPAMLRTNGNLTKSEELVMIGHPSGVPQKISDGAFFRSAIGNKYFQANLDAFGGNSGSAVFNKTTGEIEGILVRGEQDYVRDRANGCTRPNVCEDDGCIGEDVVFISHVVKKLNELLTLGLLD